MDLIYDIYSVFSFDRRIEGFFFKLSYKIHTAVGSRVYLGGIGIFTLGGLAIVTFETGISVLQILTVKSLCEYFRTGGLSRTPGAGKKICVGMLTAFELIFKSCGYMLLGYNIVKGTRSVFSVQCQIHYNIPPSP